MLACVARRQTLVQLDDVQISRLDRLAAAHESRSELIRRAIDLYLEAIQEGVTDLRYADAYRLTPEDLSEFAGLGELGLAAWPER